MPPPASVDPVWWITVVELPALAGLYWMIWRTRRDAEKANAAVRADMEPGLANLREALAAYKLEVAKSYASIAYLKEVEARLTDHLVRIENKLDRTASLAQGRTR